MSLKFIRERRAGVKSANWETKRSTTAAEQREIEQNERRWDPFQGFKLVDPFFCFQLQFGGVPP
jgi:hypothetical protein